MNTGLKFTEGAAEILESLSDRIVEAVDAACLDMFVHTLGELDAASYKDEVERTVVVPAVVKEAVEGIATEAGGIPASANVEEVPRYPTQQQNSDCDKEGY